MVESFDNNFSFLSNFFCSPIEENGILYPSVEHYFQAQKTADIAKRIQIAKMPTPGKAKRAGRKVILRPEWDLIKDKVMLRGVRLKFRNHPGLAAALLATGNQILQEGNYWGDTYWGVCNNVGLNHLGKILMQVRSELRKELKKN